MAQIGSVRLAGRWQVSTAILALLRSRGALLRYEDFVDRPRAQAQRLLALAGVEASELPWFVGERAVELQADHTVAGNPLRFTTGRLEIRADDEWRRSMPAARQTLVGALTFPWSIVYRYVV